MKLSDENPADEIHTLPLRLRCGWCKRILREGIEPESTGICADCASKMRDAETVPNWKGSAIVTEIAQKLHDARSIYIGSTMTWEELSPMQRSDRITEAEKLVTECGQWSQWEREQHRKLTGLSLSIPQADGHSTED